MKILWGKLLTRVKNTRYFGCESTMSTPAPTTHDDLGRASAGCGGLAISPVRVQARPYSPCDSCGTAAVSVAMFAAERLWSRLARTQVTTTP